MVGRMSGDVFKNPFDGDFSDTFGRLDDQRLINMNSAGSSFDDKDPQMVLGRTSGEKFGDWYGGPGGESATKIGLAALLAIAGGSVLGVGGLGGAEGGGAAGGGEVAGSGMDFGGYGTGWNEQTMGGGNTSSPYQGGGGYNWQNQMRQGQSMMNQSQDQQQAGNPLLNMLLAQRYQATPYVPIAPGALYRRG